MNSTQEHKRNLMHLNLLTMDKSLCGTLVLMPLLMDVVTAADVVAVGCVVAVGYVVAAEGVVAAERE